MISVSIDAINVIPPPVESPAPPQAESRPSFDEHLQQARQSPEPRNAAGPVDRPADEPNVPAPESGVVSDSSAPTDDSPGEEVVVIDEGQPDEEPNDTDDQPALNIAWAIVPVLPELKPSELAVSVDLQVAEAELTLPTETAPEAALTKPQQQSQQAALAPIAIPVAPKKLPASKSVEAPNQEHDVDVAAAPVVQDAREIEPVINEPATAAKEPKNPGSVQGVESSADSSQLAIANPVAPSTVIASSSVADVQLAITDSEQAIAQVSADRPQQDDSSPHSSEVPADAAANTLDNSALNAAEGSAQPKPPAFALPSRHAVRNGEASGMSEADSARFVQRVARAFQVASEGDGKLRLRLSPPELGSLRLDVSVRQGVLTAHVEAETPQARMLLLDNLPALRDRLQEQNIKLERFDVDLMNQSLGGQPQGFREREQFSENNSANTRARTTSDESVNRTTPAGKPQLDGGQLNVVV